MAIAPFDLNGNRMLDVGEDDNNNGILDPGEDAGNGSLELDELGQAVLEGTPVQQWSFIDSNGNGEFEHGEKFSLVFADGTDALDPVVKPAKVFLKEPEEPKLAGGFQHLVINPDNTLTYTPGADFSNDIFRGRGGNDKLQGVDGNDRLIGGGGDDNLKGSSGDDNLKGGGGRDRLIGQAGDDLLNGGGGNDLLKGSAGSDELIGGRGDDTLVGGAGSDIFVLKQRHGTDFIRDFNIGEDQIRLQGSLSFRDLSFEQQGNRTLINARGETLAELKGVQVNQLDRTSFV